MTPGGDRNTPPSEGSIKSGEFQDSRDARDTQRQREGSTTVVASRACGKKNSSPRENVKYYLLRDVKKQLECKLEVSLIEIRFNIFPSHPEITAVQSSDNLKE
eukprot:sb/3478269/